GCAAANEGADLCALPSKLLHDLRSDVAGAARDENRHRPAPCCKSKRWRMMWGVGAVWKRGRTAKELFIYATPMDLNARCRGGAGLACFTRSAFRRQASIGPGTARFW